MTLALDTSALLRRYAADPDTQLVLDTMASDRAWAASALAHAETHLALHRMAGESTSQAELWRRFGADWSLFWVVPVDDRCLARAVELGAEFALTTTDAVHLAAADRLGRPVTYLTFDSRQIPAALALGLDVVSPSGD
ncbi:MAG TPA: hypothetical protein DEP69_05725 [Acidimicrobiaceae bacterium]|nr:hypothetical protein [Acidimicrobiaceae bacterium]